VLNALAAIALSTRLGVDFASIQRALSSFRGAKRRFDIRYSSQRFTIIDDYGHHPTEVKATLATAKALHAQRLVCLFQPHRYSRTQLLKKEFGSAFADVDVLAVTDVYAASEKPLPGVSGETIIEEVKQQSATQCHSTPRMQKARDVIGNLLRPGDVLITLGAGNVHEVGTCLAKDLKVAEELWRIIDEHGGGNVRLYEPMSLHTTFRIGGPAQYWVQPQTETALVEVVRYLRSMAVPIRVIGRGSNLLVRDGGIRGAVIHPSKGDFEAVTTTVDSLTAAAGARLKKIASSAKNAGFGGFEWMEGVPGNLGGAIRMNAGAMGTEMFDQVKSVRFLDIDGGIKEKTLAEIAHQYRNVPEFEERYILSATFFAKPASAGSIDAGLEASRMKRRSSQPIGASAGCCFKNPEICGAGKLVDDLGLKNSRVGKAMVSPVHGNFIVNEGGASAREVQDLIAKIQETALRERGVQLETEVKIIGEEQPMDVV
jgi:UDP-N-acetylmuramate--alanine ligase